MRSYTRMFGMNREPAVGCDVLRKADGARHVTVLRGDAFWQVPVIDGASGKPLSVEAIEASLHAVCKGSAPSGWRNPFASSAPSLAILTAGGRDAWARTRAELAAHSPGNAEALAAVEASLFHVSLDLVDLGTGGKANPAGKQLDAAVRVALCGDAARAPRWFDKSATAVVSADGIPSFSFEHSWGDGIAMVRAGTEAWRRIAKGSYGETVTPAAPEPPTRLVFDLPPSVVAARDAAAKEHQAVSDALDIKTLRFTKWGTERLKAWGISPDGAAQAAIALAHQRVVGRLGATYESCSTVHFAGGRTETIRSATSDAAAWVAAVERGAPAEEQAALLRASAKR
jgi:hypothetical protein